jgi:hypothetical protein
MTAGDSQLLMGHGWGHPRFDGNLLFYKSLPLGAHESEFALDGGFVGGYVTAAHTR